MAGSLIKVDEFTISSPVASVILGGGSSGSSGLNASIDSTYDVYMIRINNVTGTTEPNAINIRFTVGGTADTSANYDWAHKVLRTNSAFVNQSDTNQTAINGLDSTGISTSETVNAVYYFFNFNNASEYSFMTYEASARSSSGELNARQGGGVLTVAQATDGVQFFFSNDNIQTGSQFVLYGLKK